MRGIFHYRSIQVSNNYSPTLLWTNPTPTTLSAGDLLLNLSKYKGIIVSQQRLGSASVSWASIYVPIGETQYLMQTYANINNFWRKVEVHSDKINFSTGYCYGQYGLFTADAWVVPNEIWGCLFEL